MTGAVVRALVLAAWLAITGTHLVRTVLPGLGWGRTADPRSAIAARLDTVQRYAMRWRPSPEAPLQQIGTCALATLRDDVGVVLSTSVDIDNTGFLPAARLLRTMLGGKRDKGIHLRMEEALDANLRLRQVEIEGQVFGIAFSATGPVDHNGLTLSWKAAGNAGVAPLPDVRPERISGGELGTGLPPGLKPGRTFTTLISTIDATRLKLAM